jgi:hypothetical protein
MLVTHGHILQKALPKEIPTSVLVWLMAMSASATHPKHISSLWIIISVSACFLIHYSNPEKIEQVVPGCYNVLFFQVSSCSIFYTFENNKTKQ